MLDYLYDFSPHLINKFQHIFALKKKITDIFYHSSWIDRNTYYKKIFWLGEIGGGHISERFSRRRRDSQGQLIIKVIRKKNL